MNTDLVMGVVLRFLPTIILVALSFVAVADVRTRTQWTNLLYQAGSLRPSQREDPKVQRGVRIPFLVVAAVFLIWPIRYYMHATTVAELSPTLYGSGQTTPAANAVTDPNAPGRPNTAAVPAEGTATAVPPLTAPPLVAPPGPGAPNAMQAPGVPAHTAPAAPPPAAQAPGAPFSPYGTAPR